MRIVLTLVSLEAADKLATLGNEIEPSLHTNLFSLNFNYQRARGHRWNVVEIDRDYGTVHLESIAPPAPPAPAKQDRKLFVTATHRMGQWSYTSRVEFFGSDSYEEFVRTLKVFMGNMKDRIELDSPVARAGYLSLQLKRQWPGRSHSCAVENAGLDGRAEVEHEL